VSEEESEGPDSGIGLLAAVLLACCMAVAVVTVVEGPVEYFSGEFLDESDAMMETISIYKRTLTSTDPYDDAAFLRDGLGIEALLAESTVDAAGEVCAERSASSTLDGFQIHFFRSFVTPGADAATSKFNTLFDDEEVWGARTPSLTFYAPSLRPFVDRLDELGAGYRVARQPGGTLTALVVRLPGAGCDVDVLSDDPAFSGTGDALAARDACPAAFWPEDAELPGIRESYAAYGGQEENKYGLPDLLVLATAWPSLDSSATPRFLALAASAYGVAIKTTTAREDVCAVSTTVFDRIPPLETKDAFPGRRRRRRRLGDDARRRPVSVRSVERWDVDVTRLTDLTADAEAHHAAFMGTPDAGWDAFLDSHVGLKFSDDMPVDAALALVLEEHAGYFRSHATGYGAETSTNRGSSWVAPVGDPWAFEIQGVWDRVPDDFAVLDYCAPDSAGDNAANTIVAHPDTPAT